ncbi:MAG: hypothetical protein EZS28_040547 [Streblomastix strix]|uniref:Uncharacterized protein n=1 Tax=Streblomastix strix TaxID=222440 RepID=A0A5J4U071_9EUKA|nr:MAG: hypothetical protein EZS28_040547 [Streblomastix strix]
MDSFLSIHHAAQIVAGDSQQRRQVVMASEEAQSVLGGNGSVSELLVVESKKKLNDVIKTHKLMTSASSQEQKQVNTQAQGVGQQQELQVGGVQDNRMFGRGQYKQNGVGGYQGYGGFWPQKLMGRLKFWYCSVQRLYQSAYNASVNYELKSQYSGNSEWASQTQNLNVDPIILGRKRAPNFITYWPQRGQKLKYEAQGPCATAGTALAVTSLATGTK